MSELKDSLFVEKEVTFVAPENHALTIKVGNKRHQFENHKLVLKGQDAQEMIDYLKNPETPSSVKALVRTLDPAAAEKIVRQHQEQMRLMGGAVRGAFASGDINKKAAELRMAQRDAELASIMDSDPQKREAMLKHLASEENLMLTEKVNPLEPSKQPDDPSPTEQGNQKPSGGTDFAALLRDTGKKE